MDLPISFGADSIMKVRDEVHAHLIQKAIEIEDSFKAFDGRGFKITFSVKVDRVRVSNVHGKVKRQGRYVGKRPDWKKAYVVLKKGEKMIEFFDQG